MTNQTRYAIRLTVGVPIIVAFVFCIFQLADLSKGEHDAKFWFFLILTLVLLGLMMGVQHFLPPKFSSALSADYQKIHPSES